MVILGSRGRQRPGPEGCESQVQKPRLYPKYNGKSMNDF